MGILAMPWTRYAVECCRGEMHPLLRLLVMKSAGNLILESALRDTVFSGFMGFRQDRALLKAGWCPEPEMGHSNAPVIIVTKGWILGVPYLTPECVALD